MFIDLPKQNVKLYQEKVTDTEFRHQPDEDEVTTNCTYMWKLGFLNSVTFVPHSGKVWRGESLVNLVNRP